MSLMCPRTAFAVRTDIQICYYQPCRSVRLTGIRQQLNSPCYQTGPESSQNRDHNISHKIVSSIIILLLLLRTDCQLLLLRILQLLRSHCQLILRILLLQAFISSKRSCRRSQSCRLVCSCRRGRPKWLWGTVFDFAAKFCMVVDLHKQPTNFICSPEKNSYKLASCASSKHK